jgi:diguanylate cyclase (GGDEF)-like protein
VHVVLTSSHAIEASADVILDRWARHVRSGNADRTRRLSNQRAKANIRPLLAAVTAVIADRSALTSFQDGNPAHLEAKHFGELRQQQGFHLKDVLAEFRHLRREVVAQIVDAAAADPAVLEMIQSVDDAVDRACSISVETFHSIEVELLTELVARDALTGLYDYGYLWDRLEQEVTRSRRHTCPVSLVMLDIDEFKRYNDRFGHLWGDVALKEISSILQAISRRSDVVARYGGDEFVLILPETPLEGAVAIAERVRQEVLEHHFRGKPDQTIALTISAGAASTIDGSVSARELVSQADTTLYEAKRLGKNRVLVHHDGMTTLTP